MTGDSSDDSNDPIECGLQSGSYLYDDRVISYDELRTEVEAEAAQVPDEHWIGGEFDFDDWLIESLMVGTIERVHVEDG